MKWVKSYLDDQVTGKWKLFLSAVFLSAVKLFRQKCSRQPNRGPKTKTFGQTLLASEKACKTVYKSIIEKKATTPFKSQAKWLSKENIIGNANVNWENTYRLPFLCTTETKLRVFQFMFLHRRIATNNFLFKIGLKQADSCSFKNSGKTFING